MARRGRGFPERAKSSGDACLQPRITGQAVRRTCQGHYEALTKPIWAGSPDRGWDRVSGTTTWFAGATTCRCSFAVDGGTRAYLARREFLVAIRDWFSRQGDSAVASRRAASSSNVAHRLRYRLDTPGRRRITNADCFSQENESPATIRRTAMRDVLTMIPGGGRGTRLYPPTKHRAKPAVPLAGKSLESDDTAGLEGTCRAGRIRGDSAGGSRQPPAFLRLWLRHRSDLQPHDRAAVRPRDSHAVENAVGLHY